MSKLTTILFLIFIVILVTLISLNSMYTSNPVLKSLPAIFPTETVVSENTISLSPNNLRLQPGKSNKIQVLIDSRGEVPTVIQMELAYDPSAISEVAITPGGFFDKPQVLLNMVNTRNGRISYAVAPANKQKVRNQSSVVATITLTPRIGTMPRQTSLSFLPKTVVRTEHEENTLKAAYGTKLSLPLTQLPEASPSAEVTIHLPN